MFGAVGLRSRARDKAGSIFCRVHAPAYSPPAGHRRSDPDGRRAERVVADQTDQGEVRDSGGAEEGVGFLHVGELSGSYYRQMLKGGAETVHRQQRPFLHRTCERCPVLPPPTHRTSLLVIREGNSARSARVTSAERAHHAVTI